MDVILSAPSVATASTSGRTVTGTATLYGRRAPASLGPLVIAPGALRMSADLRRVKLLIDHDQAQPVGYATSATDTPDRLTMSFAVPPGAAGDEALTQAANGLRDGMSVGIWIDDDGYTFDDDDVLHVSSAEVREVSLCALPAFNDARVTDVAATAAAWRAARAADQKGPTMTTAPTTEAPVAVAAATPTPPAPTPAPTSADVAPTTVVAATQAAPVNPPRRTPGTRTLAQVADEALSMIRAGNPHMVQAALNDIVPADDAGGADRPQWVDELWQASTADRPLIDALGPTRPLTALKVMGFRRVYTDLVGPYAGNKTAIPSYDYQTEPAEAPAQRFAGGNDIDRAFFDLGDGTFIRDWFVAATDDYKLKSEGYAATTLLAAATDVVGTTTVIGALNAISAQLKGLGASLDFVVLSPEAWADLAEITSQDAPWWLAGTSTLNLKNQDGTVSSITITVNPALTGQTVLGGDQRSATVYEKNPPVQVRAENVPNGGIDVGVFGYIAVLVNDDRALLAADYAPVVPLNKSTTKS